MNMSVSVNEIVNDLYALQQERRMRFFRFLHDAAFLDGDLRAIFQRIVEEADSCSRELKAWVYEPGESQAGMIFNSWAKVPLFITGTKKEILAECANNELRIMNIYSAILGANAVTPEIARVMDDQYYRINSLHDHIQLYHDAQ